MKFASEPAELAYQTLLETGVICSREQFRIALTRFVAADDESRKQYEEWRDKKELRV